MVALFPIPRTEFPHIDVSDEDYAARSAQMQRLLEELVSDFEAYAESRKVDKQRWKSSTSRAHFKLYKERSSFRDRRAEAPDASERDELRMTLIVGECAGRMENAMFAVHVADQSELAMANIFLHEDVADCAVLHTMEGPTPADPYHFLGYKWFVRKSPTTSHLVKHRDSVYVEASGLTKTHSGEVVGYHIMHSVDLTDFPPIRGRHCVRTTQSIRTIYRQRPGNAIEVFMMGRIGPAGMIKGRLAKVVVQETLFNLTKLIACGEVKRLSVMQRDLEDMRNARVEANRYPGESCALCRAQKKRFGPAIDACRVCGLDACVKCRVTKRLFESDGLLGRFHRTVCCKTCLLVVAHAKKHGRDVVEAAAEETPSPPLSPTLTQHSLSPPDHLSHMDQLDSDSSAISSPPDSPRYDERRVPAPLEEIDDFELMPPPHVRASVPGGPTTTYQGQVIDISGSLAFLYDQTNVIPQDSSPANVVVEVPATGGPTTMYGSRVIDISGSLGLVPGEEEPPTGPFTVYGSQVIDISGSLGLRTEESLPVDTPAPVDYEPEPLVIESPVAEMVIEPPQRGSSMAESASPASRDDLYARMLELQRMAQETYDKTRENQQYIVGPRSSS